MPTLRDLAGAVGGTVLPREPNGDSDGRRARISFGGGVLQRLGPTARLGRDGSHSGKHEPELRK
jgi:hypothetical protein